MNSVSFEFQVHGPLAHVVQNEWASSEERRVKPIGNSYHECSTLAELECFSGNVTGETL